MAGNIKIIVSDLHLGAGFLAEGNALEDFWYDQELGALLDQIATESSRNAAEVELIINGDAFEMLQVPNVDTFAPSSIYPPTEFHSSSEADSALKMALVVAGHRAVFEALARFIQPGPPRRWVTFIKGNHDVNLHWPAVQACVRQALGATGDRAPLLAFEELRISRDGIYVEHGNQYAESASRLRDMEEPHDPEHPGQLALPVGSWFVMNFLNSVERAKYWVDGIKPIHALICYALVFDFPFAARAISALLRALTSEAAEGLLLDRDPRSDLLRQLEDPSRVREISARHQSDDLFRTWFNSEFVRLLPPLPESKAIMFTTWANAGDGQAMGDDLRQAIRSSLHEAARQRAAEQGAGLVVFGHTHEPLVEALPDGACYINSGSWTWRADFTGEGKQSWNDLFAHPERFTQDRQLSYVRVDYDGAGKPVGQLQSTAPSGSSKPWRLGWWRRMKLGMSRFLQRFSRK